MILRKARIGSEASTVASGASFDYEYDVDRAVYQVAKDSRPFCVAVMLLETPAPTSGARQWRDAPPGFAVDVEGWLPWPSSVHGPNPLIHRERWYKRKEDAMRDVASLCDFFAVLDDGDYVQLAMRCDGRLV